MENQELATTQPDPPKDKGGRRLGSRNHTPRMGRRALDQARKQANKWLSDNGFEEQITEEYSVLSQMMQAAMLEGVKQANLPPAEQDYRVMFAMLKEIVPYTDRKLAPEPAPKEGDGDQDEKNPAAQMLELVRNHEETLRQQRIQDSE